MIGNLRTKMKLQTPVLDPDAMGGANIEWQAAGQIWAHVQPKGNREVSDNGRLMVIKSYRVTIRWVKNFPVRARLKWDDKILRVLSASDPDLRHERLHLICEEEIQ